MAEPAAKFDPYQTWLGLSPAARPPSHYRLLGLQPFEADEGRIEAAASRLIALCEQNVQGPHAAEARRIVLEIAAARLCLLDPVQRKEYDAQLRAKAAKPSEGVARNPAARPATGAVRRPAPHPPLRQGGRPERPANPQPAPARAVPAVPVPPVAPAKDTSVGAVPVAEPAPVQPPPPPAVKSVSAVGVSRPSHEAASPTPPPRVRVVPAAAEPAAELNELFSALTDASAASSSARRRGASRKRAANVEPIEETDHRPKSGKKKKGSQSLLVVGGLAALTIVMLIVAVVVLFGGGETPQIAGKQKPAIPTADDHDEAADTSESTAHEPTMLETSEPANPMPQVAPVLTPPAAADANVEAVTPDRDEAARDGASSAKTAEETAAGEQASATPAVTAKAATERLLELCAQGGSDLEIRKLLDVGAKLEAADPKGRTPLQLAIIGKQFLLAKALIAANANVNASDAQGETVLMSAVQSNDEKLLRLLLEAKADPNRATVDKGRHPAGTTPLHVAAQHDSTTAIQLLLEHGARLESANQLGATPLMVAAWEGHEEAALALLAHGAEVKTTLDAEGQTPLMYAAHGGNLAIVQAILGKGVQANHKAPNRATALSIAKESPKANDAVVKAIQEAASQEAPVLDF